MIKIFTAADSNYFTQAAVLVKSLVLSQKDFVQLTIIGSGWTTKQKDNLTNISSPKIALKFEETSSLNLRNIILSGGFPLATIYNILGPLYFFSQEEKVLYLDSDVVVLDDLSSIFNTQFEEPVAAVVDSHVGVVANPSMWRPWIEESVEPLSKYLNTGFMVINVDKWNSEKLTEKSLRLLEIYNLPCLDQDALNLVLKGNFKQIHPRFNLMPMHLMPKLRYADLVEKRLAILEAATNPAVVHFHRSFLGKPWNYFCTHPSKNLWRGLAKKVDAEWRLKINVKDLLRGQVAKLIGLSKLDDDLNSLSKLTFEPR